MKKLIFGILMIVFSLSVQGETFTLSCRDSNDAILSFRVDMIKETITHTTTSVSPNSSSSNKGEIFEVYDEEIIIRWLYPNVWTLGETSYGGFDLRYFDFANNKMRFATIDDVKEIGIIETYPKYFDCFRT